MTDNDPTSDSTTEPPAAEEPVETADFTPNTQVKAQLRLIASVAAVAIGLVYFWAAATRAPIQVGMGETTYSLSAVALVIFGVIMILGAVMLIIEWAQMRPDNPPTPK